MEAIDTRNGYSEPLKLLIHSAQAKEIIGPAGSIIKEICKNSGNAKIKVHSSTDTEKSQPHTIVTIDGALEAKENAAAKVYEVLSKQNTLERRRSRSPERRDNIILFITVPNTLVARLIGKSGEHIRSLMQKARCYMSFQQAPCENVRTPEGELARLCTFSGSPATVCRGIQMLLEKIARFESNN